MCFISRTCLSLQEPVGDVGEYLLQNNLTYRQKKSTNNFHVCCVNINQEPNYGRQMV